jgi:parallel beta-helix repeat protein
VFKGRLWRGKAALAAVAAGLIGGVVTVTAPPAWASLNNWYVATTGSNSGNSCTNSLHPCQTINYAAAEQAASGVGGTIHVAAGTYTGQVTLTSANSNLKLVGASDTSTIIKSPGSGLASDTDTDSSSPQYYVVDVNGASNVTIKNVMVNGSKGAGFLDADGNGCAQDYVGIYYHNSSGAITSVAIKGIDMPADLFGCQAGQGVYVNGTSTVTMNKLSLKSSAPTTTTSTSLAAGSYTNQMIQVASSAGFSATPAPALLNGFVVNASQDGSGALLVSGTLPGSGAPSGSTVRANAATPAYSKNGITCDDNGTTCTITNSTVQGEGPTNAIAQNGIQAFGSTATITGNTVTGDTFTGGGAGNSADGILLLNGAQYTVTGNTVSASDVNIYAGDVPAFGLQAPSVGTWTVANNTVSGATSKGVSAGQNGYGEGIQIDSTTNPVVVQGNSVTGSAQAGILLVGVTGSTVGGTGTQGNTVSGGEAGMVVGGPGTAYSGSGGAGSPGFSSSNNTVAGNTLTSNTGGLVVQGAYAPSLYGGSEPGAAFSNVFSGNNWTGNGLANVVDFSGFNGTPLGDLGNIINQYGPNDPNSVPGLTDNTCDPTAGGSASVNAVTNTTGFFAC